MKKFLFTLAALLMASSAFAARVYIPDTEFKQDQIGKQQLLPVYVELDNEYINGWDFAFTYPENLTVGTIKNNTAVTTQMAATNEDGDEATVAFSLNGNAYHSIGDCTQGGFWDPDDDGVFELYGAVKIGPTGTFKLFDIRVTPTEAFKGGNIEIDWMVSGGFDHRNGQTQVAVQGTTTVALTVEQPAAQPAPVPTFREADGMLYAECANHEVVLMDAEGNVLPNPYELPANTSYTEALVLNFKAYTKANADESGNSAEVTYQTTIPALAKKDVDSPSVQKDSEDNTTYTVIILGFGDGQLNYTVTDAEGNTYVPASTSVDPETGLVTLVFNKGAEAYTIIVDAYTSEGATCNESAHETKEFTVPALPQVKTPEINYVVNGDGTFTVTATCDTEGATIVLKDKDGNIVDNPATVNYDPYVGYNGTWTATATAPYYRPSETGSKLIEIGANEKIFVDSPSIVGMSDEDGLHFTITIIPGTTDGQLVYTAEPMGTLMRAATVNIQYERKAEDYYVDVDAYTTEGATYAESAHETAHVRVPALPQTAKPTVYWAPNGEEGKIDVWATTTTEGATITLTDGDKVYEVANGEHVVITYDIYEGYEGTWIATATATNMTESEISDECVIYIPAEKKYYQTPDPVIGEPVVTAENVTFTVTGEGTVTVTVTTFEGGTKTYTGQGSVEVTLPRGEEYDMAVVNATAKANEVPEGYDDVAAGRVGPKNIDIPAIEYTDKPEINQATGKSEWDAEGNQTVDGHYVVVTFDAPEGADVYYSIDGEDYVKWDGEPIYFRVDGDYVIDAYAVEDGKVKSEVETQTVHVTEATSVNGLVNGKTVAGVRYFNMAGQEMQEANGVTIVVTTYTDGTTSAVKVIK